MFCFASAVRQKVAVKFLRAGKARGFQRILFVTVLDLKLMLVAYTVGVIDLEGEFQKEFFARYASASNLEGVEGGSHVCCNERLGETGLGEGD